MGFSRPLAGGFEVMRAIFIVGSPRERGSAALLVGRIVDGMRTASQIGAGQPEGVSPGRWRTE